MDNKVLAIIGTGGMGAAIAHRCGFGKKIILGDFNASLMESLAESLRGNGHIVQTSKVNVSDRKSVHAFAEKAADAGSVEHVVHTAGVSPVQAPPRAILEVDLLGTALVLDEFGKIVAAGGAGVCIASMAGYIAPPIAKEVETELAHTPADELLSLPFLNSEAVESAEVTYMIAKRANQLRVKAMASVWGNRGARVNSISPGVISTPMGQEELSHPENGKIMREIIKASATKRIGTPEEIAATTAFLLSNEAGFITGTDILVDGGAIATVFS